MQQKYSMTIYCCGAYSRTQAFSSCCKDCVPVWYCCQYSYSFAWDHLAPCCCDRQTLRSLSSFTWISTVTASLWSSPKEDTCSDRYASFFCSVDNANPLTYSAIHLWCGEIERVTYAGCIQRTLEIGVVGSRESIADGRDSSANGRFHHQIHVWIRNQFQLHAGKFQCSFPSISGQRPAVYRIESVLSKSDAAKLFEYVGKQHCIQLDVQRRICLLYTSDAADE